MHRNWPEESSTHLHQSLGDERKGFHLSKVELTLWENYWLMDPHPESKHPKVVRYWPLPVSLLKKICASWEVQDQGWGVQARVCAHTCVCVWVNEDSRKICLLGKKIRILCSQNLIWPMNIILFSDWWGGFWNTFWSISIWSSWGTSETCVAVDRSTWATAGPSPTESQKVDTLQMQLEDSDTSKKSLGITLGNTHTHKYACTLALICGYRQRKQNYAPYGRELGCKHLLCSQDAQESWEKGEGTKAGETKQVA